MINSLGGIGSYQSLFSPQISRAESTSSAPKTFDEIVQINAQENASASCNSTENCEKSGSGGCSSDEKYDKMDLNQDGQVTADEIAIYMMMQQAGSEQDQQSAAEEGSQQMAQENNNTKVIDDFKNKQAAKTYSISQNLMSEVTDMISQSFFA